MYLSVCFYHRWSIVHQPKSLSLLVACRLASRQKYRSAIIWQEQAHDVLTLIFCLHQNTVMTSGYSDCRSGFLTLLKEKLLQFIVANTIYLSTTPKKVGLLFNVAVYFAGCWLSALDFLMPSFHLNFKNLFKEVNQI